MKNIKKTAFTQICERSNLYKTTLTTLLESSHDDDIKDTTNSLCHQKLAKLVATKRHAQAVETAKKNGSRFVDTTVEDREIAREVVTDFLEFAGRVMLDDIRIENTIHADDFEVLTVASN